MPTAIIDISGWAAPARAQAGDGCALPEWQHAALHQLCASKQLVWIDSGPKPEDGSAANVSWENLLGEKCDVSPSKRLQHLLVVARTAGTGITAKRQCAQQVWKALLQPLLQTPGFANSAGPTLRVRLLCLEGEDRAEERTPEQADLNLDDDDTYAETSEGRYWRKEACNDYDNLKIEAELQSQAEALIALRPEAERRASDQYTLGELQTHRRDQPLLKQLLETYTARLKPAFVESENRTVQLDFLKHVHAVPLKVLRDRWAQHAIEIARHAFGLPGLEIEWNTSAQLTDGHKVTVEMLHLPSRRGLRPVEQDLRQLLTITTLLGAAIDLPSLRNVESHADGKSITLQAGTLDVEVDVDDALKPWYSYAAGLQDFIDALKDPAAVGSAPGSANQASSSPGTATDSQKKDDDKSLENKVTLPALPWLARHDEAQLCDTTLRALQNQSALRELAVQRGLDEAPARLITEAAAAQAAAAIHLHDRHAVAQLAESRRADFERLAAQVLPPMPLRPDASFWALSRLRLQQMLARRIRKPALARVSGLTLATFVLAHLPGMMALRPTAAPLFALPPVLWLGSLMLVGAASLWAMHCWFVQRKVESHLKKTQQADFDVHDAIRRRDEGRTRELASLVGQQAALNAHAEMDTVNSRRRALAEHYRQEARRHLEMMLAAWDVMPQDGTNTSGQRPASVEGARVEDLLSTPLQPLKNLVEFQLPLLQHGYDSQVCKQPVKVMSPGLRHLRVAPG